MVCCWAARTGSFFGERPWSPLIKVNGGNNTYCLIPLWVLFKCRQLWRWRGIRGKQLFGRHGWRRGVVVEVRTSPSYELQGLVLSVHQNVPLYELQELIIAACQNNFLIRPSGVGLISLSERLLRTTWSYQLFSTSPFLELMGLVLLAYQTLPPPLYELQELIIPAYQLFRTSPLFELLGLVLSA